MNTFHNSHSEPPFEGCHCDDCVEAVVKALDALNASDPELAHGNADDLVLKMAPEKVRDAYDRLVKRCRWWACA